MTDGTRRCDEPEARTFRIAAERFDDERTASVDVAAGGGARERSRRILIAAGGRDDADVAGEIVGKTERRAQPFRLPPDFVTTYAATSAICLSDV